MSGSARSARELLQVTGAALRSVGKPGSRLVNGRSRARPVAEVGALPASCDVVVVGGGLIGVFTALVLAERGVKVVLCEKGVIAGEASGRAFGLISTLFSSPRKLPLIARAHDLWSEVAARVPADIGYRRSGFHVLFASEAEAAFASAWLEAVNGTPGVNARLTSAQEISSLSPEAGDAWAAGLLQTDAASIDPRLAAPAVAEAARNKGAVILQHTAVRAIETHRKHIVGVATEKGRVATSAVIIAGGIWSGRLAGDLGLKLPEIQAWASIGRVTAPEASSLPVSASGTNYRSVGDGTYLFNGMRLAAPVTRSALAKARELLALKAAMSGQVDVVLDPKRLLGELTGATFGGGSSVFERCRIAEPEVHTQQLDRALESLRRFPGFRNAKDTECWAGAISMTPDNMPVISAVSDISGLFIGTGAFNGVTLSPAMGEALADLAMGRTTACDLHDYRYSRFFDGTQMEYQP